MKTREEIIKDIATIIAAIAIATGKDSNRRLAAIEGMLVVLGKLDLNEELPLKIEDIEVTGFFGRKTIVRSTESYKDCILRLANQVICEQ
jgi:hypothetical protein